jgi:HEAT repeats
MQRKIHSSRPAIALAGLAIICTGIGAPHFLSQANLHEQTPPTLDAFFQEVLGGPSTLPKFDDLHRVTLRIAGMRPEDIKRALPAVFAALARQDEQVKAYACAALFAIADRPDGAELLKDRIGAIGQDLLLTKDANIQAGEIAILGSVKPSPSPEVVAMLLDFLKRPDVQAQAAGAIFELIHVAPDDPRVIAEIQDYMSGPVDSRSKINVLNALGNRRVKDARLVSIVTSLFDDSDQNVRLTAIHAVGRMGRQVLEYAEPTLRRLANDPNQPVEIREGAKSALHTLDSLRKVK